MTTIFSGLNLADGDLVITKDIGQDVVYDVAQAYIDFHNQRLVQMLEVFVETVTEKYSLTYRLPGGGYMQRTESYSNPGTVRPQGKWSVAFPLTNDADRIGGDRIDWAYMTAMELQNLLDSVVNRNVNSTRYDILTALLDNTNDTFKDRSHGDLTIKPLANNDSDLYPPLEGAIADAAADHYLVSGYTSANISDTNNPFATSTRKLKQRFGGGSGGTNVVAFINDAQADKVEDLTDFRDVPDNFLVEGDDTDLTIAPPTNLPGEVIGRIRGRNGAWVSVWDSIPADYMLSIHMDAPAPLMQRRDISATGITQGLHLAAEDETEMLISSKFVNRRGYGVGNRLNGIVTQFKASGSYDVPTVV
jgi:hypothetical protein